MVMIKTSFLSERLRMAKENPTLQVILQTEPDWRVRHCMMDIFINHGDVVEQKFKVLKKFGESVQVQQGTETTIMSNKTGVFAETYVTSNIIDAVVCTDSNYSGTFTLEYHTLDGSGNFTFGAQTVTVINGVGTLTVPCARVNTAKDFSAILTGDLYVYQSTSTVTAGVPDDGTKIHLKVLTGENRSLKAATTISSVDYWMIEEFYGSVTQKASSAYANIRARVINGDRVPETEFKLGLSSEGGWQPMPLEPYLLVKKNTDFLLTAKADLNGRSVAAGARGRLLTVVG